MDAGGDREPGQRSAELLHERVDIVDLVAVDLDERGGVKQVEHLRRRGRVERPDVDVEVLRVRELEERADRHTQLQQRRQLVVLDDDPDQDLVGIDLDERGDGRAHLRIGGRLRLEELRLDEDDDARAGQFDDDDALQVEDRATVHRAEDHAQADGPVIGLRRPKHVVRRRRPCDLVDLGGGGGLVEPVEGRIVIR